jgi:integrase
MIVHNMSRFLFENGLNHWFAAISKELLHQVAEFPALSAVDVFRMIKRRVQAVELPESTCCHTFRATGITAYLENGGTIENAQAIAAHESPRTTKLYDRTSGYLGDILWLSDRYTILPSSFWQVWCPFYFLAA